MLMTILQVYIGANTFENHCDRATWWSRWPTQEKTTWADVDPTMKIHTGTYGCREPTEMKVKARKPPLWSATGQLKQTN